MVGKPICLNNEGYVLLSVESNGRFQVRSGPLVGSLHVSPVSVLYTEDNDGNRIKLASNRTYYYNFDYFKEDIENF